jgi:prepilin-type N-terminal cleavage/methylation domain-containing protein
MTRCPGGVPRGLTLIRGFTLTELAVVLFIVALLIGGMLIPLSAQDDIRRSQETRRLLNEASDALLGFAAATGRLPCPATPASSGQESFTAGGSAANGNCSNFHDGFLPGAALGLAQTNQNGMLVDAWNQPVRYAVFTGTINGITNPMTRTDGIRNATMPLVGAATALSVCASATGITAGTCGTAVRLTDKAPAILLSRGKNGAVGSSGTDEAANVNGDAVFVSHDPTPTGFANGEFDDLVAWLSPNILFNRMIAAGRLP